jgi:serine protease Do
MITFRKFLILVSISSLLVLSGCGSFGTAPQQTVENTTQTPTAPPTVVVDGMRTSYADVVQKTTPAVVSITADRKTTEQNVSSPFGDDFPFPGMRPPQQQQQPRVERGLGSGVIVSADGTILTNHHVVEGSEKIQIEMNDGKNYDAKIVGSDPPSDLAVLKIEGENLPFLNLGNSDNVNVGDIILAIGNPLGVGQTVTAGIVSAKGRRTGLSDGTSFQDFLQIDAPINPGNSGGALVSLTGELIGINSQILSRGSSGGNIGIGFSIPSNMAKTVMEQLLKDGKVRRGQLGIAIQPLSQDLIEGLGLPAETEGVLVGGVSEGSAADKAGFKRGDVVTKINGEKVEDPNILRNKVAGTTPGTEIKVTVLRDKQEQELTATLDELKVEGAETGDSGNNNNNENTPKEGKLGINLEPLTPELAARLQIPTDTKGLIISNIDPNGSAAAGLNRGDVIMEINRQPVETIEDARKILDGAGDKTLVMLVSRRGQTTYLTVKPN